MNLELIVEILIVSGTVALSLVISLLPLYILTGKKVLAYDGITVSVVKKDKEASHKEEQDQGFFAGSVFY